ncbi:hypothetical protein [Vibrio lentus]|uniref:hypothetical protein n=1 Tax=Vibrio lentus TaxID=136468 RepID=UPI003D0E0543
MKIFLAIFAALAISACSSTGSSNAGYMNDSKVNSSFTGGNRYYDDSRRQHGTLSDN